MHLILISLKMCLMLRIYLLHFHNGKQIVLSTIREWREPVYPGCEGSLAINAWLCGRERTYLLSNYIFLNSSKAILSGKALLTVLLVSFWRTVSITLLGRNVSAVKMVILEMPLKVPAGCVLARIQTGTAKGCKSWSKGGEKEKKEKKPQTLLR